MAVQEISSTKLKGFRYWAIRLAVVCGVFACLFYGYCWGLWGRNSLLLQYFFQCKCPVASEEWRYPWRVDVLVSGCQHAGSVLSPSGRFLYVLKTGSLSDSKYLLNLETNEKETLMLPKGNFSFISDDLFYIHNPSESREYIVDRLTGSSNSIQRFLALNRDEYTNELRSALSVAKHIYLLNNEKVIVAFSGDFFESSKSSFFVDWFNVPEIESGITPGVDTDRVKLFLQENSVMYKSVPSKFSGDVISPNGKFEVRTEGIYSLETGKLIVKGLSSWGNTWYAMGWLYDSSAVVYSHNFDPCGFQIPDYDGTTCFFRVNQPVLKLKIPEEYLSP